MAEIDPLVVKLIADNRQLVAGLAEAERAAGRSFGNQERAVKDLERQMRQSTTAMGSTLKGFAASLAGYFGTREIAAISDSYTRFINQLKVAGIEGANLASTQGDLVNIATRYGVELESVGTLFGRNAGSAKELGLSYKDQLKIVEATSASLKVSGTSAGQAAGALLQLSQVLGGSKVQAQEFGSLIDGARPLLQAVANGSDRWAGSVAKLTADVKAGTVSTKEFVAALLAGAEGPIKQAAVTTLTLSGAFENLRTQLTVFVGEAGQTSGAVNVLTAGIEGLSKNLDVIIPSLAVIGVALGVGFVTNAVAAAAAARGVGTAILTAFGGPVGLAITAIAVALGGFAAESIRTEQLVQQANSAYDEMKKRLDAASGGAALAAGETRGVGKDALGAIPKVNSFAGAIGNLADQLYRQARAARVARVETLGAQLAASQGKERDLAARTVAGRNDTTQFVRGDLLNNAGVIGRAVTGGARSVLSGGRTDREVDNAYGKQVGVSLQLQKELAAARNAPITDKDIPGGGGRGTPAGGKKTKPKAGPKGKSAETLAKEAAAEAKRQADAEKAAREKQQQIAERIAQSQIEYLQAEASLTQNAAARYQFETQALEKTEKLNDDRLLNDAELNEAQREKLRAFNKTIAGLRQQQLLQGEEERLRREQLDLTRSALDAQDRLLQDQLDATQDRETRRKIELERVDIAYMAKKAELAAALDTATLAEDTGKVARIQADIAQLAEEERAARARVVADYQSPGQRYAADLNKKTGEMNDDFERVAVGGLERLNDGLVDAITGAKSLGDVFKATANGIIKDLLRIAIQQAIIKPLANALFPATTGPVGGGIGGGITSLVGKFFGRASGGYVAPGQMVRVNEGTGRTEFFRPSGGGNVVPLGRTNAVASAASGAGGMATVRLELSGDLDARIISTSGQVAIETVRAAAPGIADMGAQKALRTAGRPSL